MNEPIFEMSSTYVCAGSSSKQGEAGARPQDQIKLLVHRPGEMSQHQKIIPRGLPRNKALDYGAPQLIIYISVLLRLKAT